MKLERCERGHFYDAEKYDACPHCTTFAGVRQETVAASAESMDIILPYELGLFQIKELLGKGGTSKVFRIETKQKYALKVVDITNIMAARMAENEYRISQWLNDDKHFVKYYAMYKRDGNAYFVQPEIRNLVTYIREEHPDFQDILNIFKDVAQSIVSLHENGIVHLDIKPTNIFVDDNGNGKLGDFSAACKIIEYKEKPVYGGTPKYFSPEVFNKSGYSGKEDMYSFGITMYYILSAGKFPYDFSEINTRGIESVYIDDAHIPELIQNIIKKATAFYPSDRYANMGELLSELQSAAQKADVYQSFLFMPLKGEGLFISDGINENTNAAHSENPRNITAYFDAGVGCIRAPFSDTSDNGLYGDEQKNSPGGNVSDADVLCSGEQKAESYASASMPQFSTIQVPPGKPVAELKTAHNYAGETTVVARESALEISKVRFSAVAPRTLIKGDYTMIDIVMYEDSFRSVVDDLIKEADAPVKETKSGPVKVKEGAKVKIQLTTPDFSIEDNVEEQEWCGEYLTFNFAIMVPEKYAKRQVLFMATVYIDDVIATRLKFIVKCWSLRQQKISVTREDVLSVFVSYASQDRNRVAMIIQGMQKARPDMDIFFDVESLRSGESWEEALWSEIDRRDTLFLCWSHNAKKSEWVEREWRYAFDHKGEEAIEPIPLEPPSSCPPPEELRKKHFNDRLLYVIKEETSDERKVAGSHGETASL